MLVTPRDTVAAVRARRLQHAIRAMAEDQRRQRGLGVRWHLATEPAGGHDGPFDERRVALVREFLRREFRDCVHRDFFAFDQTAQVFLIETGRGFRHMLVIPKATFEDADFSRLCNAQLAATLKLARESRVMLTLEGPVVLA